jgi:hypothetical protein
MRVQAHLQIGSLPAVYSSNWLSVTSNTIVAATPSAGNSVVSNLAVTVAWGSGPYTQLTNAVNYVLPQLTSANPTLPLSGDYLTIIGTKFGTNKNFYSYIQIASLPAVYPNSANWISITDTQIVVIAPTCGEAPLTSQTLYLAWGSGSYVSLTSAVNYASPTISGYGNLGTYSGYFYFDLYGYYFGPLDNQYWSNVAVGPIGGCTPYVINNGYIQVTCHSCGGVTNVAVALHWYTVSYVQGPATFSISRWC